MEDRGEMTKPGEMANPGAGERRAPNAAQTVRGRRGVVAAAHPLAAQAGADALREGGSAADAMIAAQAVLAVVAPDACGLGGDGLATLHLPGGALISFNGTGRSARSIGTRAVGDDGRAATVPGLVSFWADVAARHARLPLCELLAPAIAIARNGFRRGPGLLRAIEDQRARLVRGGAEQWPMLTAPAEHLIVQPDLADLLEAIGREGIAAFHNDAAPAIARAVAANGGSLDTADMAAHETVIAPPLAIDWRGWKVAAQPPSSQGILLLMALQAEERALGDRALAAEERHHALIELTGAAFAHRDRAFDGMALLSEPLEYDPTRASGRAGPRAYLHTAGIATADADGLVCSSLVSVFDDFGSAIFVPEHGFTLNNRAAGFTTGPNAPAGGRRPVHTLAPALVLGPDGPLALATPGADGQVQVLLQCLSGHRMEGLSPSAAIARPRWRSEGGRLKLERGHPFSAALMSKGHEVDALLPGANPFGAIVAAGLDESGPFAHADWRRDTAGRAV